MANKHPSQISLRAILKAGFDLELKAQSLYRKLAGDTTDPDVNETLLFLAGEEGKHAEILKKILGHWADAPLEAAARLDKALPDAAALLDALYPPEQPGTTPLEVLQFALDQERRTVDLYEFFEEKVDAEFFKSHQRFDRHDSNKLEFKLHRLDEMIAQERKHAHLLERIIAALKAESGTP